MGVGTVSCNIAQGKIHTKSTRELTLVVVHAIADNGLLRPTFANATTSVPRESSAAANFLENETLLREKIEE